MTSPIPPDEGSAPVAAPPSAVLARRKRARLPLIIGAVALLALVGSGAAYTAINLPRGCGLFGAARRDLPCDVPLPAGAGYARPFGGQGGAPAGATEHGWVFAVPRASGQDLHDFYARQLGADGWACVTDTLAGRPVDDAIPGAFTAYKDGRGLFVAYGGGTGEVSILLDDFHSSASPC